MYNKYFTMKRSELKEAIKSEIKSVLSENRYDINDPNSPMGKLSDEYESSGLKGIVDNYGLDVVLMMLSSGEYGDRLNEAIIKEVYQTTSKMEQIVDLFQDMMDDEYDGVPYEKVLNRLVKFIDDDYKAAEREGEKFSRIREEDEPTAADLKKKDSVASISNKLQKLTAKMKKKAKEFKEAEGKAKDKLKDELKDMTAEKKKLEKEL